MSPEELVRCIDFRYITDALTPEEAVELLRKEEAGKAARLQEVEQNHAVPIYTTSASWLGYSDEKMSALLKEAKSNGFHQFKFKVGGDLERDKRRLKIAREVIGDDDVLMLDANQVILSRMQVCARSLRAVTIDMVCSGCSGISLSSRALQTFVH